VIEPIPVPEKALRLAAPRNRVVDDANAAHECVWRWATVGSTFDRTPGARVDSRTLRLLQGGKPAQNPRDVAMIGDGPPHRFQGSIRRATLPGAVSVQKKPGRSEQGLPGGPGNVRMYSVGLRGISGTTVYCGRAEICWTLKEQSARVSEICGVIWDSVNSRFRGCQVSHRKEVNY
jgi:hypothetical protein